ncbi:MAG: YcgN family cysteine cluster protein [Proteobacteria bacterium]|nr:MAG: YcgN family cysteine cluster protein [Pseudomonadota bacterium]
MKNTESLPFWKEKTLAQMSSNEWESLCDGCGKCCLHKIEDEDTGEIAFTNVACRLLDAKTCRCSNYTKRIHFVKDCQVLNPKKVHRLQWLPSTCAYRLLADGRDLPKWHPLVSGSRDSVHKAGISVKNKIISEDHVKDLEDFVVDWIF